MSEKTNTFEILSAINVNDKIKTKMGLKYLSWAEAWNTLKKAYPDAYSTTYSRTVKTVETTTITDEITHMTKVIVQETENEVPYFTDGMSAYVKVGVTVEGVEYIETYPIMNLKNAAVPVSMVTMTDVNKSIQRAFVKACARHGLGLYIYSGEDLPDAEKVTINFADIAAKADASEFVPFTTAEEFNGLKSMVISKLQATWDPNISDAIMSYGGAKLNGKRISVLEFTPENNEILYRIHNYISQVETILMK